MSEQTIDSESSGKPAPVAARKRTHKPVKKATVVKKLSRPKKAASKPKADRANKKAEVIAMMKRAKGATLPEIMAATGWQAHTVRGFVSLPYAALALSPGRRPHLKRVAPLHGIDYSADSIVKVNLQSLIALATQLIRDARHTPDRHLVPQALF
ncbi:MAG: DUF3489 domain-containing protein [Bryobacteraceae bacterium]